MVARRGTLEAGTTYDGDDLGLDDGRKGNQVEVEGEIELEKGSVFPIGTAEAVAKGPKGLRGTHRREQQPERDCLHRARHGGWWLWCVWVSVRG